MYHAIMQSCANKVNPMQVVKTVGKSGQISLGRSLAGADFIMKELPSGDILLQRALVIPMNECWLQEPEVQARIATAQEWMKKNPAQESNLDALMKSVGLKP